MKTEKPRKFACGESRGKHRTYLVGFTLMELLIVVSIIAILVLMALLTLNYKAQIQKARDIKRKNDLQLIKTKLEDYYNDSESYPAPPGCSETSCCKEIDCQSSFLSPYLQKFPCDPQNKKYTYCAEKTKSQWYKIYTNLEYLKDKVVETSGCKEGCFVSGKCFNCGISSPNTSIVTESFCGITTAPTTQPTVVPGGTYYACQVGICNVVGDPLNQCGAGKQFPTCYLNSSTCGNCGDATCLPAPQCYQ